VGKRSAKFLGSQMWRKRDVTIERATLSGRPALRATDVPSKISVTRLEEMGEPYLLRELSHRVHQFE